MSVYDPDRQENIHRLEECLTELLWQGMRRGKEHWMEAVCIVWAHYWQLIHTEPEERFRDCAHLEASFWTACKNKHFDIQKSVARESSRQGSDDQDHRAMFEDQEEDRRGARRQRSPTKLVEFNEAWKPALFGCLEKRSPYERELLHAHHVENVPLADLARKHDKPLGTIKAHCDRARGHVRRCLEAKGFQAAEWGQFSAGGLIDLSFLHGDDDAEHTSA